MIRWFYPQIRTMAGLSQRQAKEPGDKLSPIGEARTHLPEPSPSFSMLSLAGHQRQELALGVKPSKCQEDLQDHELFGY